MQGWAQDEPVTPENAGHRLHTRCERETLVRFPRTRAVLFTIRTHLKDLDHYARQPSKVQFEVLLCFGGSARVFNFGGLRATKACPYKKFWPKHLSAVSTCSSATTYLAGWQMAVPVEQLQCLGAGSAAVVHALDSS